MWRRVLSLGLPGTFGLVGLVGLVRLVPACGAGTEMPHVAVATDLTLPKGVLGKVTKLSLTVLEGAVTCDTSQGQTALPNGPDGAKVVASRDLGTTNCAAGAKFCGDLSIEKSE